MYFFNINKILWYFFKIYVCLRQKKIQKIFNFYKYPSAKHQIGKEQKSLLTKVLFTNKEKNHA